MFNVSGNTRVIESMNLISLSMLKLIRLKHYPDISIVEICEDCGVSRKTFYRNFDTKEDIINYILYRKMSEIIDQINLAVDDNDFFRRFMEYWKNEDALISMLYHNNLWDMFTYCLTVFIDLMKLQEPALNHISNPEILAEYYYPLYASILATLVKNWTKRKHSESIDQLYLVYHELLTQ